jgi:hypothetical protein
MPREARIVDTLYGTEDVVVADIDAGDIVIDGKKVDKSGAEDATAFIQKAIDACFPFGGGTVWLGAGRYRVTGAIEIRHFVTLRGDWNSPDAHDFNGDYGTLIIADVPSGTAAEPGLFRLASSAGCLGLTVWYPNQRVPDPLPYPYTFEIPGGACSHMQSTVKNCTMLNSFRGIGVSATMGHQLHELTTVHNVHGTILDVGLETYNSSDVDVYQWIKFDNKYWAEAGEAHNAPDKAALDAYTKTHARGFVIGDIEWGQFTALHADHCLCGIDIVSGTRTEAAVNISFSHITNCARALNADIAPPFKGYAPQALVSQSVLQGDTSVFVSVSRFDNILQGWKRLSPEIRLARCTTGSFGHRHHNNATAAQNAGAITVAYPDDSIPSKLSHDPWAANKPSKPKLYDVTKAPYNAPFTNQTSYVEFGIKAGLPPSDATAAIQQALDDAGANGGGVAYMPAGWYRIDGSLSVPAGVELRGSSPVPVREIGGLSYGTTLMAYAGKNSATSETDAALVTLGGDGAGIRGLKIYYPENTFWPVPNAYPYSIRGNGADLYVINVGLTNSYRGIDFWTNCCPDFFIRRVVGISVHETIKIGAGAGKIEACLTNLTSLARTGYGLIDWHEESCADGSAYWGIVNAFTRQTQKFIYIDGAKNVRLLDNFSYGAHTSIHVRSGSVAANSHGADGNNKGACYVADPGASLAAANLMMCGEAASSGNVTFFNSWIRQAREINHVIFYYGDGGLLSAYLFCASDAALPAAAMPVPPSKPSHIFRGWFTETGELASTVRIAADTHVHAKWMQVNFQ